MLHCETSFLFCFPATGMSNPVPVTSPPPSYCKPGYTVYGSSCFKVDTTRRTWDDADQSCRSDGAYLASITSSYEQAYVQSLIRFSPSLAWIGLKQNPVRLQNFATVHAVFIAILKTPSNVIINNLLFEVIESILPLG